VLNNLAEGDRDAQAWIGAFRQRLESLGWNEGRNLKIDTRWGAGDLTRLRAHAAELVSMTPDVAFADSTPAISALQQATPTIPIVFVGGSNPVGSGFVASLARPQSNITGFISFEPAIGGKWLGTLKEIAPRVARAALIYNPKTHTGQYFPSIETAAQSLSVELVRLAFGDASDIERGIDDFARAPNGGLLVLSDPSTGLHRELIVTLAARHRLPAVYPFRQFVIGGGSYPMASIARTNTGAPPNTSAASSTAKNPPSFRCRRRPSSSCSSISRPRRRSASTCRTSCSRSPTR